MEDEDEEGLGAGWKASAASKTVAGKTTGFVINQRVLVYLMMGMLVSYFAYLVVLYQHFTLWNAFILCTYNFVCLILYSLWLLLLFRFAVMAAQRFITHTRDSILPRSIRPSSASTAQMGGQAQPQQGVYLDWLAIIAASIFTVLFVRDVASLSLAAYPPQFFTSGIQTLSTQHRSSLSPPGAPGIEQLWAMDGSPSNKTSNSQAQYDKAPASSTSPVS